MSTPTPIALCITDLDRGGAERALVEVVTRLDRREWAPVVYCIGPRGELVDSLDEAGIETHCLNATPRDALVVYRLAKHLGRQKPALLQSFLFHANLAGRLAAWLAGVPVVLSGIRVAEREKTWHLRLERWTKRLVDRHVCVSQSVADFTEKSLQLRPGQLSVIPNGVDAETISTTVPADLTSLGVPAGAETLLFAGRLHPQKGLSDLLHAFQQLVAADKRDVHLLIAGRGPLERKARKFVEVRGLDSRVHWLGTRRDLPAVMRASTMLVLPSLWEGMPNVVLEAMAAGLPVVATAVDGTQELLAPRATGWLCRPGDVESLTTTLRQALDAPAARREFAARAQQTARKHFTWDTSAEGYSLLWRELLGERG